MYMHMAVACIHIISLVSSHMGKGWIDDELCRPLQCIVGKSRRINYHVKYKILWYFHCSKSTHFTAFKKPEDELCRRLLADPAARQLPSKEQNNQRLNLLLSNRFLYKATNTFDPVKTYCLQSCIKCKIVSFHCTIVVKVAQLVRLFYFFSVYTLYVQCIYCT